MADLYAPFRQIADHPLAYARQWRQRTAGPVIGILCSYAPEEIIVAAGGLPLRLLGSGRNLQEADANLQAYSCSLVRGVLADRRSGCLDFLDGSVFPHTCDSIQRLSDVWRLLGPDRFHADLVWPVTVLRPGAEDYAAEILKAFGAQVAGAFGKSVDAAGLDAAAGLYNRIRQSLCALYELLHRQPGHITGDDLFSVLRASHVMDRHELADALEKLLAGLRSTARIETGAGGTPKRLLLAGGVCDLPDLHRYIEAAGAVVVGDDLCTGARYAAGRIDTGIDIWRALARCYLERTVCPAKHAGITSRGDAMVGAVRRTAADGVVLVYLKFCDPHLFDYPYLKQRLEAAGVPVLMVELQEAHAAEGQLRTRLEAFVEML